MSLCNQFEYLALTIYNDVTCLRINYCSDSSLDIYPKFHSCIEVFNYVGNFGWEMCANPETNTYFFKREILK